MGSARGSSSERRTTSSTAAAAKALANRLARSNTARDTARNAHRNPYGQTPGDAPDRGHRDALGLAPNVHPGCEPSTAPPWPNRSGDELAAAVLDSRADDARRSRVELRWLRQQDTESATFAGLLLDAAERGGAVLATTQSGTSYRGSITAVGSDFVSLTGEYGLAMIRTADIVTLLTPPSTLRTPDGDRTQRSDDRFDETLAHWADQRVRVSVRARGCGELIAGELLSCGVDVCSVVERRGSDQTLHVQLSAVSEVVIFHA